MIDSFRDTLITGRLMHLVIPSSNRNSSLLHADRTKYCKGLMCYTHSLLPAYSWVASLWSSTRGFHILEDTSKKTCPWTSLKATLSGSVNNKYSSETPGCQSLGSHFAKSDSEFHTTGKITKVGQEWRILKSEFSKILYNSLSSKEESSPKSLERADDLR